MDNKKTNWAVQGTVFWTVDRAVNGAAAWAVPVAPYWAVSRALNEDPPHPGLQDFLRSAEE